MDMGGRGRQKNPVIRPNKISKSDKHSGSCSDNVVVLVAALGELTVPEKLMGKFPTRPAIEILPVTPVGVRILTYSFGFDFVESAGDGLYLHLQHVDYDVYSLN